MDSVRTLLTQWNLPPLKKMGQSFLHDGNIIRRIVEAADLSEEDRVVEIGSGLGLMTEEMARKAGRLIALEIDHRLLPILRQRLSGYPSVEVVPGDVLKYDFSKFRHQGDGRIKVVGNIPYHISTPILFHLLAHREAISSMVLMVQKELADRIAALPGSKAYGIPSVLIARCGKVKTVLNVPPTCFYPAPSVYSSVIRIQFLPPFPSDIDWDPFACLVRRAFAQRRKTLWNNLRSLIPEGRLSGLLMETGIDGRRRAETLTVEEFSRLATVWANKQILEKHVDNRTTI